MARGGTGKCDQRNEVPLYAPAEALVRLVVG